MGDDRQRQRLGKASGTLTKLWQRLLQVRSRTTWQARTLASSMTPPSADSGELPDASRISIALRRPCAVAASKRT